VTRRDAGSTDPLFGKRILVVEDEPLVAMDYLAQVARAGAHVAGSCGTVREALQMLNRVGEPATIDAAIVDFVLADRNSEPLQAALKERNIPFLVVSAYPRPLVRTHLTDRILQKPVPAQVLCDELRDVCRRAA
jgi:DNA-binding response OmpR family regulator